MFLLLHSLIQESAAKKTRTENEITRSFKQLTRGFIENYYARIYHDGKQCLHRLSQGQ